MSFFSISVFKKYGAALMLAFCFISCDSRPQVLWEKFDEPTLSAALKSGKPTLAYFYAAWCRPCQQLRSSTFRDERIVKALSDWNRLKADMSFREDKITIARTQTFEVWALPTLIIYSPEGKVISKIQGYITADKLLRLIKA